MTNLRSSENTGASIVALMKNQSASKEAIAGMAPCGTICQPYSVPGGCTPCGQKCMMYCAGK